MDCEGSAFHHPQGGSRPRMIRRFALLTQDMEQVCA